MLKRTAISLSNIEKDNLSNFSVEEYRSFLETKIRGKKEGFYILLDPPYYSGDNYIETKEQYQVRQDLIDELVKDNNTGIFLHRRPTPYPGYLDARDIDDALQISRTSLYTIMDKNNMQEDYFREGKRAFIKESSIITYLSERHVIPSGFDFNDMMETTAKLKIHRKGSERESNEAKLQEILNSEKYKEMWEAYFKYVPEHLRVKVEPRKRRVDNYSIYVQEDSDDYFSHYNPNFMLDDSPLDFLPQFYDVKYVSEIIGVTPRTVLKYTVNGSLSFYRIGGRKMISLRDIKESKKRIESMKRMKRPTAGRKTKFESLITIEDFLDTTLFPEKTNEEIDQLRAMIDELSDIKAQIKELKKKDDTIDEESTYLRKVELKGKKAFQKRLMTKINKAKNTLVSKYFKNIHEQKDSIETIMKYRDFIKLEKEKRRVFLNEKDTDRAEDSKQEILFWENKILEEKKVLIQNTYSISK